MDTMDPPLFWATQTSVHRLGRNDIPSLQALLDRCPDHWMVHEGRVAPPDAAEEIFRHAPPDYESRRIIVLGVFDARGRLVGIVTSPPDFPNPGDWCIGLFLLEPSVRSQGLGGEILRAFEDWIFDQGATRCLLVVVDDNPLGRRFWDRMGYREVRRLPPRLHGPKSQGAVEMERRLVPPTPVLETPPEPRPRTP